jgi:hypothetical protein
VAARFTLESPTAIPPIRLQDSFDSFSHSHVLWSGRVDYERETWNARKKHARAPLAPREVQCSLARFT